MFMQIWQLLRDTLAEWSKDGATVLGAALAFYTLFSLAPLLIILTVVVGFFLGQEAVQADLLSRLTVFVGPENAYNLMEVIQNAYRPGSGLFATVMAGSLMLFGSTSVFLMLKSALNHMWGINKPISGFWSLVQDRGKSFLVVLCVGLLIFISIVLKSLLAAFYTSVSEFLVMPALFIVLVDHGFSLLLMTTLFTILYKVLPDARVSWGYAARGALVSALLFSIGNFFLGLYLTRQSIASAYGAAGSLVVILLWVFYSSQIIFLGAEFTQVYARKYGQDLEAEPFPPDPAKE